MDKPYRVYYTESMRPTFFSNEGDGDFVCTHGGWTGTHTGKATLEHFYGKAEYASYRDLSETEYKELFYKMENPDGEERKLTESETTKENQLAYTPNQVCQAVLLRQH